MEIGVVWKWWEGEGNWLLRFNKGSLRPEMEISILNILVKGFWQGEESQYIQELAHLMVKNFGRPIKVDKNQHHIQKQPFKVI